MQLIQFLFSRFKNQNLQSGGGLARSSFSVQLLMVLTWQIISWENPNMGVEDIKYKKIDQTHPYLAFERNWQPIASPHYSWSRWQLPPAYLCPKTQDTTYWKMKLENRTKRGDEHLVTVSILPVVTCSSLTPAPPTLHSFSPLGNKTLQVTCGWISPVLSGYQFSTSGSIPTS